MCSVKQTHSRHISTACRVPVRTPRGYLACLIATEHCRVHDTYHTAPRRVASRAQTRSAYRDSETRQVGTRAQPLTELLRYAEPSSTHVAQLQHHLFVLKPRQECCRAARRAAPIPCGAMAPTGEGAHSRAAADISPVQRPRRCATPWDVDGSHNTRNIY